MKHYVQEEQDLIEQRQIAMQAGMLQRSIIYYKEQDIWNGEEFVAIQKSAEIHGVRCRIIDSSKIFEQEIIRTAKDYLQNVHQDSDLINHISYASGYDCWLSELFQVIGRTAQQIKQPVCFLIPHIQRMKRKDLSALIVALHSAEQLQYPIMIIGMGSFDIIKRIGNIKPYSERLFEYKKLENM